jgi:hypothetical protein
VGVFEWEGGAVSAAASADVQRSRRDRLDLPGQLAQRENPQVDLLAGVVDVI